MLVAGYIPAYKALNCCEQPSFRVACCAPLAGRWLWSQARSVPAVVVQLASAAKVGELDVAGGVEQQVLRLQVAAQPAHAGAVIYRASCETSCLTPPLPTARDGPCAPNAHRPLHQVPSKLHMKCPRTEMDFCVDELPGSGCLVTMFCDLV